MYKSTQTHPKFTWRFAECQENKATYHTATAYTEDEARSQLPDLPLVFTARIRREVSYA
ncbi:host cell division inhibitor Icd-like protein [Morganella psychrotolerans]|nr:host cell division inhibitor Icd-like protein [Morganella psychrotolerans]